VTIARGWPLAPPLRGRCLHGALLPLKCPELRSLDSYWQAQDRGHMQTVSKAQACGWYLMGGSSVAGH